MTVLSASEEIRTVVGSDVDIVGFDPRGIGFSTPALDCFKFRLDDPEYSQIKRTIWSFVWEYVEPTSVNDDTNLNLVWHRNSAKSQLCAQKDRELGEASIFKHASTPYVANDMIGIVDAWSQWRDGEQSPPDVNFWGFSYGSILGATFAAMFPDRVGRMMIDGIVDTKNWFDGDFIGDYVDAEKILDKFGAYCKAAGKKCGLYRRGESAKDINARLHKTLYSLKSDPIASVSSKGNPDVITYTGMMRLVFKVLYSPMYTFPLLANITAEIESENRTHISGAEHYRSRTFNSFGAEGNTAVICSDQQNRVSRLVPRLCATPSCKDYRRRSWESRRLRRETRL